MDVGLSGELENAAIGLVKAMQYGLDRYPAIVFDGQFVVYGMTDRVAATHCIGNGRPGSVAHDAQFPPFRPHPADVGLPHGACWNHHHHGNRVSNHECSTELYALDAGGDVLLAALFLYECNVETSIKVGHYQPDAVVSSYNDLGGNPWTEIRSVLGAAQHSAATGLLGSLLGVAIESAGNRTEGGQGNRDHRNLIFRETDVIGHPVSALSDIVAGTGYLCESETIAFYPYFMSSLDALSWRMEIPEMFYPASSIPGLREIGTWPLQTWGGVYPRTGWTTQAEEPKAAAINAQRAGDIVTRGGQPHIYDQISPSSSADQRIWSPGPLVEGDASTGEWQMLLPRAESSCSVFGTNDL